MSENSPSNPTYQIEIKNNQYHLKEFGVYFFGHSQVQSEFIHPNVHPSINLKKIQIDPCLDLLNRTRFVINNDF